jgi:hypothetical protein
MDDLRLLFPRRLRLTASAAGCVVVGYAGAALAQDSGYHGPLLSWTGKTPAAAPAPPPAPAAIPAPPEAAPRAYVAPARRFATEAPQRRADPTPSAAPAARSSAMDNAWSEAPLAPAAPAAAPLIARRDPAPAAPGAAMASRPPGAPHDVAEAAPPTAPAGARGSPHFYSLHREYGITPDPIARPKDQGMVLIGPPDSAKDRSPGSVGDDSDDAKPAHHGDGQGSPADDQPGDN